MTCSLCLDTGWAFMPHSDEARERCLCQPQIRPNPQRASPSNIDLTLLNRYHAIARGCVTRKTTHG